MIDDIEESAPTVEQRAKFLEFYQRVLVRLPESRGMIDFASSQYRNDDLYEFLIGFDEGDANVRTVESDNGANDFATGQSEEAGGSDAGGSC